MTDNSKTEIPTPNLDKLRERVMDSAYDEVRHRDLAEIYVDLHTPYDLLSYFESTLECEDVPEADEETVAYVKEIKDEIEQGRREFEQLVNSKATPDQIKAIDAVLSSIGYQNTKLVVELVEYLRGGHRD